MRDHSADLGVIDSPITRYNGIVIPERPCSPTIPLVNCCSPAAARKERGNDRQREKKYVNAHRGCPGGPKCRHCTWDSLHISVEGPHAKYLKGHRGHYRGDIDGAIDDFLAALKLDARRLLLERAKEVPALGQFHLNFS